MLFLNFINSVRKTKQYKVLGIISAVIVPIILFLSIQSVVYYNIDFVIVFQLLYRYILFYCFVIILTVFFIILNICALYSARKTDCETVKYDKLADFGYCLCLAYIIYCLIFFVIIIPNSVSSVKNGVDYINTEARNFYSSKNGNIEDLCISSKKNTLNCFADNIPNGHFDEKFKGNVILAPGRIYYFKPMLVKGEPINNLQLQNAEVLLSDRLTLIPPVPIARIFNDKNADKQIIGYRLK